METSSGDLLLVEVEEQHGWVMLTLGDRRYDLTPESAFDLVDALTIVSNNLESHVGE